MLWFSVDLGRVAFLIAKDSVVMYHVFFKLAEAHNYLVWFVCNTWPPDSKVLNVHWVSLEVLQWFFRPTGHHGCAELCCQHAVAGSLAVIQDDLGEAGIRRCMRNSYVLLCRNSCVLPVPISLFQGTVFGILTWREWPLQADGASLGIHWRWCNCAPWSWSLQQSRDKSRERCNAVRLLCETKRHVCNMQDCRVFTLTTIIMCTVLPSAEVETNSGKYTCA